MLRIVKGRSNSGEDENGVCIAFERFVAAESQRQEKKEGDGEGAGAGNVPRNKKKETDQQRKNRCRGGGSVKRYLFQWQLFAVKVTIFIFLNMPKY